MDVNTKPGRRRALDHLPWGKPAEAAPGSGPRAIEFQRGGKNDITAFPYQQLIWVNYFKKYGIIVHFGSHTVHVLGSNLESVYEGIRDQTLTIVKPEEPGLVNSLPGVESVFIKQVGQNAPGFVRPDISTLKKEEA